MQEEMNEKTVSLIIRGTKITAVVLKDAMKMFLRHTSNRVSNSRDGKGTSGIQKQALQPGTGDRTGKTSLRKMMKDGSELSNIEITDENIKSFEKIARKYSIQFSLMKDKSRDPPRYLVFFKARDVDVMQAAFREYTGTTLNRKARPSIRKKLQNVIAQQRKAKHRERERTHEKAQKTAECHCTAAQGKTQGARENPRESARAVLINEGRHAARAIVNCMDVTNLTKLREVFQAGAGQLMQE